MGPWFRFYVEALEDPKVQRLDGETFKGWVNILCLASKNEGILPPIEDIAFSLRLDINATRSLIERLLNATLIDTLRGGPNGVRYAPHGWAKRQYKSDTSTERVKRFRKRKKAVTETPPEPEPEPDNNPPAPLGADAVPYVQIQGWWNEIAGKHRLPTCQVMTDRRRRAIRARHGEHGIDGIRKAIDAVSRSDFCLGKVKDFRADFDFVFQAKSFTRLIEGSYGNEKPAKPLEPVSQQQLDRWALARKRYPDLEFHKAVMKVIEDEQRQLQHSKEG